MKLGQIIKVNESGLVTFAPGIRCRLVGEIGLVVKEKYDLAHRVIDGTRVYPSIVRFEALRDLEMYDDGVMIFDDQAEILS
tara:strand:- start:1167 stop:1409 length:243 start_codon:yes stop_codon:yes gene_type:complete